MSRVDELLNKLGSTSEEIAKSLEQLGIKGERNNPWSCPLTNYLDANGCLFPFVYDDKIVTQDEVYINPSCITEFIHEFDDEHFPELDEDEDHDDSF